MVGCLFTIGANSRITDTLDKYLDYTKIPSLQYHLVLDPETVHVVLYHQNGNGNWQADVFAQKEAMIDLPLLGIRVPLADLYAPLP